MYSMTDSSQEKLNEYLKRFPKHDIINILNEIDNKISALHNSSSKDFLYFNKLLKEYYSKIKEVSEANNKISLYFRKELTGITDNTKDKNSQQERYLANIDHYISFTLEKLATVYSSFDLLIVPFSNFKQNLTTLKYIIANLSLHLTYIELSNKNELKESLNKLNETILKASKNNEIASKKSTQLVNNLLEVKSNAYNLKSKNSTEVSENIKKLNIDIKKLDKEEFWPDNFLHRINTHSQNCFANMGEIITNLQYHDIIRQKMEHIQESQKQLISGLDNLENHGDTDEIEHQLKVIIGIPEITEVQVAQLLYTNRDYQTSIEKITTKLIEVGREMKALNSIYISLSSSTENFQYSFIKHISETQKSYSSFNKTFRTNWEDTSKKIENIIEQYLVLKNNFNDVFIEEKNIRLEIKNFEKLIKANGENFSIDLVKRLVILVSDLKLNSNSLKNSLNSITDNVNRLKSASDDIEKETGNYEVPEKTIQNLSDGIQEINNSSNKYSKLSLDIANEITTSLNNIEYYNFFEGTVEDIVKRLNEINEKINYEELKKEIKEDHKILEKIEKLYTMKSERDIHSKLVESDIKANEIFANDSITDNIDDGDIELF